MISAAVTLAPPSVTNASKTLKSTYETENQQINIILHERKTIRLQAAANLLIPNTNARDQVSFSVRSVVLF